MEKSLSEPHEKLGPEPAPIDPWITLPPKVRFVRVSRFPKLDVQENPLNEYES